MKVHRLALIVPEMTPEEFEDLVEDIRVNGQIHPVVLFGDEILDGRHRWLACERLGIAPKTTEYNGDSPAHFVCSANLRRRSLSTVQRAAVGAEMMPTLRQEMEAKMWAGKRDPESTLDSGSARQPQSRDKAAQSVGVSKHTIDAAERIRKKAESGDQRAAEVFQRMKENKVATVAQAEYEAGTKPLPKTMPVPKSNRDSTTAGQPKTSTAGGLKAMVQELTWETAFEVALAAVNRLGEVTQSTHFEGESRDEALNDIRSIAADIEWIRSVIAGETEFKL